MLTVSEWLEAVRTRCAKPEPVTPAVSVSTAGIDRHELRRRASAVLRAPVPAAVRESLRASIQFKADCAVLSAFCARGTQQDKARAALCRLEAMQGRA
ncbi:hypothetical protein [Xenophilus azovorans]|uniref:hypothetical protein n=1 Tax=Xenophilus azovorans TaxID=151755 RepID=UPI00056F0CEA|nr:hypothetical protein [Xenophilus azovorans]